MADQQSNEWDNFFTNPVPTTPVQQQQNTQSQNDWNSFFTPAQQTQPNQPDQTTWLSRRGITSTGRVENPDMGNITDAPLGFNDSLKRTWSLSSTTTDEGLKKSLAHQFPDATFSNDKMGNPMITFPQSYVGTQTKSDAVPDFGSPTNTPDTIVNAPNTFYINKPGLNGSEIERTLPYAITAPIGAAAGVGAGLGTLTRALVSGLTAGATSVGQDVAGTATGSEEGINVPKAALSTALGAGGDYLATYLGRLIASMKSGVPTLIDNSNNLTTAGKELFDKAGLDPNIYDPSELKIIADKAAAVANNPTTAAAQAGNTILTKSQGMDIPLTQGQLNNDPAMLAKEADLRLGTNKAANIMNSFDTTQRQKVADLADQVASNAGTTPTLNPVPNNENDLGDALSQTITDSKSQAKGTVNDAYDAVWDSKSPIYGGNLKYMPDDIKDLPAQLADSVKKYPVSPSTMPNVTKVISNAQDLLPDVDPNTGQWINPQSKTLLDLATLRQQITNGISKQGNTQEDNALMAMRNRLDDYIANNPVQGPAVDQLNYARALANEYYNTFQPSDPAILPQVKGFLKFLDKDDTTGQQVVNKLLGAKGITDSNNSSAIIQHLQNMSDSAFGTNAGHPYFTTPIATDLMPRLQQTVINRIFDAPKIDDPDMISSLSGRIDDAINGKGSTIMRQLFPPATDDTILGLQRMKESLDTAKTAPPDVRQNMLKGVLDRAAHFLTSLGIGHAMGLSGAENILASMGEGTGIRPAWNNFLAARAANRAVNPSILPNSLSPIKQGLLSGGIQMPAQSANVNNQ
jgi:hypothetical protein